MGFGRRLLVQHAQVAHTRHHSRPERPRIVVVEDEAMIAIMLEDMLEDLGCEVAAIERIDRDAAINMLTKSLQKAA